MKMNDLYKFDPTRYTTAHHQIEGWIVFRELPEKAFSRMADHAAIGDCVRLVQKVAVTHPRPLGTRREHHWHDALHNSKGRNGDRRKGGLLESAVSRL
jgi:hypothetical protein